MGNNRLVGETARECSGMDSPAQPVLKAGQRRFLLCLAARIAPESAGAAALRGGRPAARPRSIKSCRPRPRLRQLEFKLLLLAIRWMTVPVTLRWFERLRRPGAADRWLRLENAPLTLLRRHSGA